MDLAFRWHSQLAYLKRLAASGVDGFTSTHRQMRQPVFEGGLPAAICAGSAIGAGLGVLGSRFARSEKRPAALAYGGFTGTVVGCAVALAWTSRHFTRLAAGNAARSIGAVSDQHWLESHPIDYA